MFVTFGSRQAAANFLRLAKEGIEAPDGKTLTAKWQKVQTLKMNKFLCSHYALSTRTS